MSLERERERVGEGERERERESGWVGGSTAGVRKILSMAHFTRCFIDTYATLYNIQGVDTH